MKHLISFVLVLIFALVPVASSPGSFEATGPSDSPGCQLVDDGWASTVGPYPWYRGGWEYPWEQVLALRQRGGAARGSITAETVIDAPPVALHAAMWDHSLLGTYVIVENVATGAWERSLVLDAMAAPLAVDLSPDQITSLNGGIFRAGLRVRVWACEITPSAIDGVGDGLVSADGGEASEEADDEGAGVEAVDQG